ncbi:alpha-hydroxy acid oxidase [Angustibacter aerolatus]
MSLPRLLHDHYERARRVLDAEVFDSIDSGTWSEETRAASEQVWSGFRLRPRVLTDVRHVDTSTELLGDRLASPVVVAPTAYHRFVHEAGEVATAAAARAAGALMVVSMRVSVELEDVAAAAGPWWFQVYATQEPAVHRGMALRAAAAGASALVLTGDTPVVGIKPRVAGRPVRRQAELFGVNTFRHVPDGVDPFGACEQSAGATTDLVAELAELTGLPVLVKGLLRGDEARRCVEAGAAGVLVSNHGGRQLDRSIAAAHALPEVRAAVPEVPVLVDGGVRSGLDVLTALALGADAVMLGRPVLWALASDGEHGVDDLLGFLRDDLEHAMALAGATTLAGLTPDLVVAG